MQRPQQRKYSDKKRSRNYSRMDDTKVIRMLFLLLFHRFCNVLSIITSRFIREPLY